MHRPRRIESIMIPFLDSLAPLLGCALLVSASLLTAQAIGTPAAPRPDPEVAALLDKAAARRGIAAGAKTRSLGLSGTFTVTFDGIAEPVAKGTFGEQFLGGDLARHVSNLGNVGTMEKGVWRDVVWEIDPHMGAKVHGGVNAAAVRRYFAMLRGDDPRTLYRTIEKAGVEKIDDHDCTVLRMTADEGAPDTWYVDAGGDVVRIDTALPAPESADAAFGMPDLMDTRITFSGFREVSGGRFAMRRGLRMGPATVTSSIDKAEVGVDIDVERFAPPKAVTAIEQKPIAPAFGPDGKPNYQVLDKKAQPVASIRMKVKAAEISSQLAVMLPEVMAHLNAVGAKMAGAPFSRYHTFDGDEIDLEAGIPVLAAFEAKGRVKNGELPGGKVVTCWHVGPYEKLEAAHRGLQAHVAEKGLKGRGGVWEVYWTDPGMVPDPAKWKTQLFAPIE
jgi:effector-binding domain-containing protein